MMTENKFENKSKNASHTGQYHLDQEAQNKLSMTKKSCRTR